MKRWMRPITPGAILLLALAPAGGDAQEQEERFIRIDTLNVRDTLYHLGDGGANALALIDEINGGVILVGTKLPGWGQPVLDAVYQVTDLPVTTIVSTHSDLDHTGSNAEFPDVVEIIAHENTRANMARMEPFADGAGLPTTTFADRFGLLEDLDRIELYYFGPAHTDGDIVVVFPRKRTAYLGDLFPDKAAPVIDTTNGGSGIAFPETLARAGCGHRRRRPGDHGPRTDPHDLRGARPARPRRATGVDRMDDLGRPDGVRRLQPGLPCGRAGLLRGRPERRRGGRGPRLAGALRRLRHGTGAGERGSDLRRVGGPLRAAKETP